ncbi:MAG: prepilin-type N-terminal cleavage/methylation domain-containing protein [Thermoanaerobaculaceae bacterium]
MSQKSRQRGMTLVEVLIALLILLVVATAVIQVFSLSYLVNMGSLARTDLQYRAQRVVEALRYLRAVPQGVGSWSCGIDMHTIAGPVGPVDIPNNPADPCWGVNGFRVVESNQNPFILSYQISDGGPVWVITVTARPATVSPRYLGMAIAAKGVRYGAQISK